jgi:hypothetical protein
MKIIIGLSLIVALANADSCKIFYQQQELSEKYNESIAHAIHSMNTIGLQLFCPYATQNNAIPTVNHNLKEESKVINYAPDLKLGNDFSTFTMNVIDQILSHVGVDDDGLGSHWSPTERIAHKFHMFDLWHTIKNEWELNVKHNRPSKEFCNCITDVHNNGIYDAVAWVADHYTSGTPITLLNRPIPKLEDANSWKIWKERLLHYYTPKYLHDAALYLDCVIRDFNM